MYFFAANHVEFSFLYGNRDYHITIKAGSNFTAFKAFCFITLSNTTTSFLFKTIDRKGKKMRKVRKRNTILSGGVGIKGIILFRNRELTKSQLR